MTIFPLQREDDALREDLDLRLGGKEVWGTRKAGVLANFPNIGVLEQKK